jgi:hypothetical protein
MATLGFFHNVYDNLKATEYAVKSAREFYPDSFYMLIGDGGVDHHALAKEYNCEYFHYSKNLGYGSMDIDRILSYMQRVLFACMRTDTTHLMKMEDDVVIMDKVILSDSDYLLGQPIGMNNKLHPELLRFAESVSGVKPETDYYCFGGGSIMEVSTYINNYSKITDIFRSYLEKMKEIYPQMGWEDCYFNYFYYLCGKPTTLHSDFYTVSPWPNDIRGFDLNTIRGKYRIVDRYKNNYK